MIKNINADFGDSVEFETVEKMAEAIKACGYEIPEDGLKEGRDYEVIEAADDLIKEAEKNGFATIQNGVFLNTSESMISDQKGLADEDSAKNIDLSEYPYWVTTDDGLIEPISGKEEIEDLLRLNQ